MTIKIINNVPHRDVVKEVVCRKCGVTLEYTPQDVQEERTRDYTGDVDIYKIISCPNCRNSIRV